MSIKFLEQTLCENNKESDYDRMVADARAHAAAILEAEIELGTTNPTLH